MAHRGRVEFSKCVFHSRGYVHDMKAFAGEVRSSVLSGAHVSWKCAGGAPWCSWLGRTLESQIVNGDAGMRVTAVTLCVMQ